MRRTLSSGEEQMEDEELSSLKPQKQLFTQPQTLEGILPVQKGTPIKVSRRELRQIPPLELSMRRSSIGASVGSIPIDSIEVVRRSHDFKL